MVVRFLGHYYNIEWRDKIEIIQFLFNYWLFLIKIRVMKKTILILLMGLIGFQMSTVAQKYAFVDTDYVLRNIPAYQASQEQLNQLSKQWQSEIEDINVKKVLFSLYRSKFHQ